MSNTDQIEYWNGEAGKHWVEHSVLLDTMLAPFSKLILEHAQINNAENILDIGCGSGALSLQAAKFANNVLGVDVSAPLITFAAQQSQSLEHVDFIQADATTFSLERQQDVVLSRFGIMFFADPVLAFSNIRQQVMPGGRMIFACWQSPVKNMWALAPIQAAMPFLDQKPSPTDPAAPGPFAFADPSKIATVLEKAGWIDISLEDWSDDILLPGANANEAASFMMNMGPLSKILKEQHLDASNIHSALTKALAMKADEYGRVSMAASVWIVKARNAYNGASK